MMKKMKKNLHADGGIHLYKLSNFNENKTT